MTGWVGAVGRVVVDCLPAERSERLWQPLVVTGEVLGAEMGMGRVKVKAEAGAVQVHRTGGWRGAVYSTACRH